MRTLSQILTDCNAYLDLEATEPTGTELTTRQNYANQAVLDAASVAQFNEFHQVYTANPSVNASVSLPSGFRELMGPVRQMNGSGWDNFEEIKPMERYERETSDKYLYILGNSNEGYTAVFNGLTANATISLDYQRFPSGFATLTTICELPDPQYVTARIIAYVLESRSDDRFPLKLSEANTRLTNMIGRESKLPGGGVNTTRRQGVGRYAIGE